MKILYVDLAPGIGGSILSLQELVSRLDRNQFEPIVTLAAQSKAGALFRGLGVPVRAVSTPAVAARRMPGLDRPMQARIRERLRSGRLTRHAWHALRSTRNATSRSLPLTWRLLRLIRDVHPKLVHVNDLAIGHRAVLAAAWLAGVPVVCHVRSLAALEMWDRLWARTVRRFIFISEWVARDRAAQGIPAGRGQLIYNGLDPDAYAGLPNRDAARAVLEARWCAGSAGASTVPCRHCTTLDSSSRWTVSQQNGVPPMPPPSAPDASLDRPTVAVVGRLVPWKGQDLFLRAMRKVVDSMPHAQGLIVGEPESFSLDYGDQLRKLRSELGLDAAIRFVDHITDMALVYAAINLLAHTSVTPEPFGRVVIEAMASGLPVVTPAEGGGREIVVDGVTGRHVEPRDADALAAAILDLLGDPGKARAIGAAGRERVRQLFSLDRLVAEMTALYREISPERQHSRM